MDKPEKEVARYRRDQDVPPQGDRVGFFSHDNLQELGKARLNPYGR